MPASTPFTRRALALVAVSLAAATLTGCGSSSGDDASPATDALAAETEAATESSEAPEGEEPEAEPAAEVDLAGAEEVLELMTAFTAETRTGVTAFKAAATTTELQEASRELRNVLFAADDDLRGIEVGDAELADRVLAFYEAAYDAIAAYDVVSTSDPSTLGADEADALNRGVVSSLDAAVALQDAAHGLVADGAVPDGPSPGEVLAVPEDFPVVSGVRQPAFVIKPEGEPPITEFGPCGEPSPNMTVEPLHFVSTYLEEPSTSAVQRVLVFADEDGPADFIEALEAFTGCDDPADTESVDFEPRDDGEGVRVVLVDSFDVTTTILAVPDGRRLLFVDAWGDGISPGGDAAAITGEIAETILEAMQERAAG